MRATPAPPAFTAKTFPRRSIPTSSSLPHRSRTQLGAGLAIIALQAIDEGWAFLGDERQRAPERALRASFRFAPSVARRLVLSVFSGSLPSLGLP